MARKDISDYQVCWAIEEKQRRFAECKQRLANSQLNAYQRFEHCCKEAGTTLSILAATTGQCAKVCWRAMERAHERGYLEFGTSLNSAWLTDKGKELIRWQGIMDELRELERHMGSSVEIMAAAIAENENNQMQCTILSLDADGTVRELPPTPTKDKIVWIETADQLLETFGKPK
jgi:hypothetical protein